MNSTKISMTQDSEVAMIDLTDAELVHITGGCSGHDDCHEYDRHHHHGHRHDDWWSHDDDDDDECDHWDD